MSDGKICLSHQNEVFFFFFFCVNIEADMQESDKAAYRNWTLCLGGVFPEMWRHHFKYQ